MQLLNVGCGRHFHPAWINMDLVACAPAVVSYDLRRGLPFADESFNAVYHSHVLEHMDPTDARALIGECFRVLRPGGTLRVAVPDLETIARCYLTALDRVEQGEEAAWADHAWMTLELLDQLVRTNSGGRMAQFVRRPDLANRSFVQSRMGQELFPAPQAGMSASRRCQQTNSSARRWASRWRAVGRQVNRIRQKLALAAVGLLAGKRGRVSFHEGMFRQSGEVHRWMYDRLSLKRLLEENGFANVTTCRADQSKIRDFASYELDTVGGEVRKPDSLFMEGSKPPVVSATMEGHASERHTSAHPFASIRPMRETTPSCQSLS